MKYLGQVQAFRATIEHGAAPLVAVRLAVAFAKAMGGSITGVLLAIVLFGGPALSVVVLGLLATRIAGAEQPADREHEHVG